MDQKWSHAKVLGKYFEVYGQARPITPEAGEKKAPFWNFFQKSFFERQMKIFGLWKKKYFYFIYKSV